MKICELSKLGPCTICGDQSTGIHFNVISCESCKAFFGRNVNKIINFRCKSDGKCEMNKVKRKDCRCCRLQKCISSGMIKEWVFKGEQWVVRKAPRKKVVKTITEIYPKHKSHQTIYKISQMNDTISEMIDSNSDDSMISQSSESSPQSQVSESESQSSDHEVFEGSSALVPIQRPITDYNNNLTEIEGNYLTELLMATKPLKTPIGIITSQAFTFEEAMDTMFLARKMEVKKLIELPQNLVVFKELNVNNKLQVFKDGIMQMHYLRTVKQYLDDGQGQYFIVPTVTDELSSCLVRFEVIKQIRFHYWELAIKFLTAITKEWDSDHVILDLMSVIILFHPVKNAEYQVISLKRQIYCQLLQRYLLLKYRTEEKAIEKYSRLMIAIELAHSLYKKTPEVWNRLESALK